MNASRQRTLCREWRNFQKHIVWNFRNMKLDFKLKPYSVSDVYERKLCKYSPLIETQTKQEWIFPRGNVTLVLNRPSGNGTEEISNHRLGLRSALFTHKWELHFFYNLILIYWKCKLCRIFTLGDNFAYDEAVPLLRNSKVPHFTLFLHLCRSLLIILVCTITKILVAHFEGQT
jgi:hypothetical protein